MPLFEYRCSACGHQFEELIRVGESDPETCPACGAVRPMKQNSCFSASVKGGGSFSGGGAPSCPTGQCPFAQG
jgi:putative FmdB family regulatory protein